MVNFPVDVPFHLFASCILVKGHNRSCIYDLQRDDFEYIPNTLYYILDKSKDLTFNKLSESFELQEDKDILIEYFNFLRDKEFIFFSNIDSKFFPKYEIKFSKPYNVSTMVVDISLFNLNHIKKLLDTIFKVKAECLVLRFRETDYKTIIDVLRQFNDMPTRIIQVFIDKKTVIERELAENIFKSNDRVSVVINCNDDEEFSDQFDRGIFISINKDIINERIGITDISDFSPNLDSYMESRLHNTFYNKRVYIDQNGYIYRHERDNINFGSIYNLELLDVLLIDEFRTYWDVKKDDIHECLDCEYRYMCADNRLPVKTEDGSWKFKEECNYNPYTSEWKKDLI